MDSDEVPETGYGPDTPSGDNLLNDYAQGMAAAFGGLARARGDRVAQDDALGLVVADSGSPAMFGNLVVARRPLDGDGWRAAVDFLHAFYGRQAGGPYLVFSPWSTPDLTGAGFGRIGHPPLMLRMPGTAATDGIRVDGLEIRPVDGEAGARDWERTLVDGFPEPALQPVQHGCLLPGRALAAEGWRWWVGYLGGRPVSVSAAHVGPHHVHVEFIATVEEARGRGIGRALTAVATDAVPTLPAMLISSDAGRSVYERLGYRSLLRFTLWAGHRDG